MRIFVVGEVGRLESELLLRRELEPEWFSEWSTVLERLRDADAVIVSRKHQDMPGFVRFDRARGTIPTVLLSEDPTAAWADGKDRCLVLHHRKPGALFEFLSACLGVDLPFGDHGPVRLTVALWPGHSDEPEGEVVIAETCQVSENGVSVRADLELNALELECPSVVQVALFGLAQPERFSASLSRRLETDSGLFLTLEFLDFAPAQAKRIQSSMREAVRVNGALVWDETLDMFVRGPDAPTAEVPSWWGRVILARDATQWREEVINRRVETAQRFIDGTLKPEDLLEGAEVTDGGKNLLFDVIAP